MSYYLRKTKRYKKHFICFDCRKNFKQPNEKDLAEKEGELSLLLNAFYMSKPKKEISKPIIQFLKEKYFQEKKKCPQCRNEMTEVSMAFETPPKKDVKQWEKLRSFYNAQGFVVNGLTHNKKEFINLLECSLDWHIHMFQNANSHKSMQESFIDAKERLKQEIENHRNEINRLK